MLNGVRRFIGLIVPVKLTEHRYGQQILSVDFGGMRC